MLDAVAASRRAPRISYAFVRAPPPTATDAAPRAAPRACARAFARAPRAAAPARHLVPRAQPFQTTDTGVLCGTFTGLFQY